MSRRARYTVAGPAGFLSSHSTLAAAARSLARARRAREDLAAQVQRADGLPLSPQETKDLAASKLEISTEKACTRGKKRSRCRPSHYAK